VTSNREIFSRINLADTLPSSRRMTMELVRLCHTENTALGDIIQLIETDPALSVTLLKTVNCHPILRTAEEARIASIPKAAAAIGKHGMITLALGFSMPQQITGGPCPAFDYERFWSKSLAQAIAAASIAEKSAVFDAEEMYACGLLAAIGELALATSFPKEYGDILGKKLDTTETMALEKNAFGLDRHELAAELFHSWGLPEIYGQAVALYPSYADTEPNDDNDGAGHLAGLLRLAVKISDICLADSPDRRDFTLVERLATGFGIDGEEFPAFFNGIATKWEADGELLRIRSRRCPPYKDIKVMDVPRGDAGGYQPSKELSILAVDDDPISLQTLVQCLRVENRRVLAAQGGEHAFKMAFEENPDIVITDWRMPDTDGIDLCKLLRRTKKTEHTYIIMLSGCETDDDLVQAFNAGADDYVMKPFSPKVLEARIRSGERLVRYYQTVSHDREIIKQYASQLSDANNQLRVMSITDPLTGLSNRRNAIECMKNAIAEVSRFQESLSCIMLDIDHFKHVNDTYGHDVGDLVLRDVAKIFSTNVRAYDTVSRMGGEEFLVICRRSNLDKTRQLAERLRQAVADHETHAPNGQIVRCTISCGVATWQRHYRNDSEFLKKADNALYQAKNRGRNRVEVAT